MPTSWYNVIYIGFQKRIRWNDAHITRTMRNDARLFVEFQTDRPPEELEKYEKPYFSITKRFPTSMVSFDENRLSDVVEDENLMFNVFTSDNSIPRFHKYLVWISPDPLLRRSPGQIFLSAPVH